MSSELSSVNILLVDDHLENLLALEAMLEGLGQNLVKAQSGEEALRCLLNQDFAVILLDVQMPGMDGFETATLIRQRERSSHTPIIFLTAFNMGKTSAFTGYALGAVDYLLKPIDPPVLTSKVAVFVDLFKKTLEVKRQASQLALINDELRCSEERFRSLSACSPIGIFLTDTAGRCTYTNPSCQAICGFRLEASWELGWATFMHPEDRDRILPEWLGSMHKGWAYSAEFRLCSADDQERWVQVRTSPMLADDGKLLGQVGTIEDITERKQAEAIREQIIREQAARQQAEVANRMKDEFLMLVSHELRTPLNATMGWSRLLLCKDLDAATTTRALETIHRNACAQTRLIEDLLDVSRLMQGSLRLALQPLQLEPLLNFVLETMLPLAAAKSIQLETYFDPEVGSVVGDSGRLQQVVLNLLSNAVKFTPAGGLVELRLEQVEVEQWDTVVPRIGASGFGASGFGASGFGTSGFGASGFGAAGVGAPLAPPVSQPCAQITVTDTGIGIPADFLPHVFDRFCQADSGTTRTYGGLGLGLAIAHHLVQLHGGRLTASSEGKGKGATFTILLPLVQATPAPYRPESTESPAPQEPLAEPGRVVREAAFLELGQPAEAMAPSLALARVLLVEDHDDNRDFLTAVLSSAGAQVTAAASVQEALQCLSQSLPQVLITDISLPEADGYTLLDQVQALAAQHQVALPAIALTAHAHPEDRQQALAAGFQLYLTKPITPEALVSAVAQVLPRAAPAQKVCVPVEVGEES